VKRERLATKARRGTVRPDRARKQLGLPPRDKDADAAPPAPPAKPAPAGHVPVPPAKANNDVKAFYRTYAAVLVGQGRLEDVDYASFELLADVYATACAARRAIEKDGHFRLDENKVLRRHPAIQVQRDAIQTFARLAARFGLTPADREGMAKPRTPGDVDPLEVFLRGRLTQA